MATITFATLKDVDELKKIADKYSKEIGFIIKGAFIEAINKKEVIILKEDEKIIGFCKFHRRKDKVITIYEICILEEARGKGYGRLLIDKLKSLSPFILLKCPVDNASNNFYKK